MNPRVLLVMATLLTIAGCASVPNVDQRSYGDLSNYHSFALVEPPSDAKDLANIYLRALYDELIQHGYAPAEPDKADFFVTYHYFTLRSDTPSQFEDGYLGYGMYSPGDKDIYYYPGNTYRFRLAQPGLGGAEFTTQVILVDIRKAKSQEMLWRGWAQFHQGQRPDNQQIRSAVARILAPLTGPTR